ncbi:TOM1-like protein 2 [Operophtera brumata]|uniref:TOM1-like protein 2 n=1 Tax=Operophtera brumata TaxID=104452 RepID=A0A0L7KM52_OPEBR|nr:TOM1-like protein 2 [Operophtera brumata]
MSFFGVGNPFSTPVGQKIEQATDGSLPSENWGLNMEICDIVNSSTDGPRDAVKAIRKRLNMSAGKNYTVVMYTLTVLETCVKNCGKAFHVLVCSKEFISELVQARLQFSASLPTYTTCCKSYVPFCDTYCMQCKQQLVLAQEIAARTPSLNLTYHFSNPVNYKKNAS